MQSGSTERLVYKVLAERLATCEETARIAKLCGISELQAIVAVRRLKRLKMLPDPQMNMIL
jgi:hypothetical protein